MNGPKSEKLLSTYPTVWRRSNGDVLRGMFEESVMQRPENAELEVRMALRQGLAVRFRWALPYLLAGAAIFSVLIAFLVLAVGFTEENETLVQVLIFIATPLLCACTLWAAISAYGMGSGTRWFAGVVSSFGIVFAGGAHVAWYAGVDAVLEGANTLWACLIAIATGLIGAVIAGQVWPAFSRSMSAAVAVLLTVIVSFFGAATFIGALATPFFSPALAASALAIVIILHRKSLRRRVNRPAPAGYAP